MRCKFKLDSINRVIQPVNNEGKTQEFNSLVFTPVYANNDPEHENSKFWKYTPSGKLEIGTVNAEVVSHLELGKEYYLDITAAS